MLQKANQNGESGKMNALWASGQASSPATVAMLWCNARPAARSVSRERPLIAQSMAFL